MSTAVIDCDFDSHTRDQGGGTITEDEGGVLIVRHDTAPSSSANAIKRIQLRFPLSAITAGSDVTDVSLQILATGETVAAGEDVNVHAYNSTGDDDPDPDAAGTKHSRSIGGTALGQIIGNGTGSKTLDLGTTADGQVEGNLTTPGIYSIGMAPDTTDWDDADEINYQHIEDAGTDPATLTVTYTAPASTLALRTLMGVGA